MNPQEPSLLHWRLTRIEETVDNQQDRLQQLEARPGLPSWSWAVWGRIVALIALLGLGLMGRLTPELVALFRALIIGA